MRRVCACSLVHSVWGTSGQAREGDAAAASVYGYTGTQSANLEVERDSQRVATRGRRMRRVCTGTPVHHEQTITEQL
jgi:hypothetical protein